LGNSLSANEHHFADIAKMVAGRKGMGKKNDKPELAKMERPAPWPEPPEPVAQNTAPEADWSSRKYRKKPVIVEAEQIREPMSVNTPFGTVHGAEGDWLVTAGDGQQWFCTDEYFRLNYEPVSE
jgi:hypothetical protein